MVDFGKNDPIVSPSRPALDPFTADSDVPPSGRASDFSMAMLIAAFGIGLYAVSRATGWVLAGFIGR